MIGFPICWGALVTSHYMALCRRHEEPPYAVHARRPLIRPSDADLDEIAAILNKSNAITIHAGAGCAGAHDGKTLFVASMRHDLTLSRLSAVTTAGKSALQLLPLRVSKRMEVTSHRAIGR
jgi:hypothetical protein